MDEERERPGSSLPSSVRTVVGPPPVPIRVPHWGEVMVPGASAAEPPRHELWHVQALHGELCEGATWWLSILGTRAL